MSGVLFIKTSSLGDVVHNIPAIRDMRRHRPEARISWAVEEPYVPLVQLVSDVDDIIPVASRRWRRQPHRPATWREIRSLAQRLRTANHDVVIDTQGLMRTGLLARLGRGARHGYDLQSVKEPLATLFYDHRHAVPRFLHAIDRNRILAGKALGYEVTGEPSFGLAGPPRDVEPYAVFLHGSARPEKEWDELHWQAVAAAVADHGLEIVFPWGTPRERIRSEALVRTLGRARVPPLGPLGDIAQTIGAATLVVGLDTGLVHLAAAFGTPLIAIFAASNPELTGPRGPGPITVLGRPGAPPSPQDVIAAASEMLARAEISSALRPRASGIAEPAAASDREQSP